MEYMRRVLAVLLVLTMLAACVPAGLAEEIQALQLSEELPGGAEAELQEAEKADIPAEDAFVQEMEIADVQEAAEEGSVGSEITEAENPEDAELETAIVIDIDGSLASGGCQHAYVWLYSCDANGEPFWGVEDEECTPVDECVHSFTKYVSKQVLECTDCGEILEEIEVNDYVTMTESHAFYEGGDGKGGCYYCHMKATKGCKHLSYSSVVKEYSMLDDDRHYYSECTLAPGYYACEGCGYIGDGYSWGFSDWEVEEGSDLWRIEEHSYVDGVCACGRSLPVIEFTSHADGDRIEVGETIEVSWECGAYTDYIVNVKLLDGEPTPDSDEEAGEYVVYEYPAQGSSAAFVAPDAAGKYVKVHVQAWQDGELVDCDNQIYLMVVDRNQITLTGKSQIAVGGSMTIKAVSLAGKSLSAKSLKWTTSDKAIATVSKGKVKGKKVGVATITATAKDGTYGVLDVMVCPKGKSVVILRNGEDAGKTIKIEISETDQIQLAAMVNPEGAIQNVSWKSSSTKIAKVAADGTVNILKTGTVTITATAKDGSKKKDTVNLKIVRKVQELEITGKTEITAGKTATLKAVVTPSNATTKTVSWASSDKSVATISSKGKVTAKKLKTRQSAIITATAKDGSGVLAEHEIFVCPAATSVKLYANGEAAKTATITIGSPLQLEALVLPEGAIQSVTWKSSSTKIAKVSKNGLVTPVKKGTATITATAPNGKKTSCKVKVVAAPAAEPASAFDYTTSGGKVTITNYKGNSANVIVPEKINGYPVKEIGFAAFYERPGISSISLPDSVTKIADNAFMYCGRLESVRLPQGLESIGKNAFGSCYKLRSLSIPSSVKSIGESAFMFCTGLESVTLPEGLTSIGAWVFTECNSLKSIVIPASVKSIGEYAFYYCESLQEIQLPDGVKTIGKNAFTGCKSLNRITIPRSVEYIEEKIFVYCKEDLVICGYTGSEAERYAEEQSIRFEAIDAPAVPEMPVITGGFNDESVEVKLGDSCRISGNVNITGGTLGYITLNVDGVEENYATIELTGAADASLETFEEFQLDTTRAPFNAAGVYTLNLWARAEGSAPDAGVKLDSMTIIVTENTAQQPALSVEIDGVAYLEPVNKDTGIYKQLETNASIWPNAKYPSGIDKLSFYLMTGGGVPVSIIKYDDFMAGNLVSYTDSYSFGTDVLDPNGSSICPGIYIPDSTAPGKYYLTIIAEAGGAEVGKIVIEVEISEIPKQREGVVQHPTDFSDVSFYKRLYPTIDHLDFGETTNAERYAAIIDQFDVAWGKDNDDVDGWYERTYKLNRSSTYCNYFAADVSYAMGCYIPLVYNCSGCKKPKGSGTFQAIKKDDASVNSIAYMWDGIKKEGLQCSCTAQAMEYSANLLYEWFCDSDSYTPFGWIAIKESEAAARANQGYCTLGVNDGHVFVVHPNEEGQLYISQAGKTLIDNEPLPSWAQGYLFFYNKGMN